MRAMVDHHTGSACELISLKASPAAVPWSSTYHVHDIHADSTPNIAPGTPMQGSMAWQKPLAHESPESLPSSEVVKGITVAQYQPIAARCEQAGGSTPSKVHNRIHSEVEKQGPEVHKENLLSVSLSKYKKQYQSGHTPALATPPSNHDGQHHGQGATRSSKASYTETSTSSPGHTILPHKEGFYSGFNILPVNSPPHAQIVVDKQSTNLACKTYTRNSKLNFDFEGSTSPYCPAPGEVANNAYKLYSEMFPSTSTAAIVCSPSSAHSEGGLCFSKPFVEDPDKMQLLPSALYEQESMVTVGCDYKNDRPENGKKPRYTSLKEERILLKVKKEPVFDSYMEPGLGITHTTQNSWDYGDNCRTSVLNSAQERMEPGGETPSKGCVALKQEQQSQVAEARFSKSAQPSHLMALRSPKPSKAIDIFHSSEDIRLSSSFAEEATNGQPAAGLKLITSSAYAQFSESSATFFSGEPSIPLPSETFSRLVSNGGAGRPLAHCSSSTDADWGKFLALSATPVGNSAETTTASTFPSQKRFQELQAFLKQCDEANSNECIQALRSLPAAARSSYAVELETRAISLSLEEGKEMKRTRSLNVLGRIPERSFDDAGATPQGPRLPAPGALSKLKHVP